MPITNFDQISDMQKQNTQTEPICRFMTKIIQVCTSPTKSTKHGKILGLQGKMYARSEEIFCMENLYGTHCICATVYIGVHWILWKKSCVHATLCRLLLYPATWSVFTFNLQIVCVQSYCSLTIIIKNR